MSRLQKQIHHYAETQPEKIALIGDTSCISYKALPDLIEKRIELLHENDVIVAGLQMDNGPDWILWDIALAAGGFVCVPLPAFFTVAQRQHAAQSAGISHFITREGIKATGIIAAVSLPAGTAKITFTSGTTGTPKGVCLPQQVLEEIAGNLVTSIGAEYADRHLSILPLSILLENVAGAYSTLLAGGTCHLYNLSSIGFTNPFQPDFEKLSYVLDNKKITSGILVPELLRGLMNMIELREQKFPALRFLAVGGSKVAPKMVTKARSLGLPVYEGYGLSECGSVVALNTPHNDKPGTVGRVLPHIDLSIRNGEIIVHNPAFLGYLDAPHAGDFATGDLGNFNGDDYLAINGRSKNVIITSFGRNISPEWIESLLMTAPDVAQAFVYGDARPFPSALIVPSRKGADTSMIVEQVNKTLPAYARISNFYVVSPFMIQNGLLTPTGRLRRNAIFKQYHSLISPEETHDFLQSSCQ